MRRNANITGRFDEDLLEHSVEPVETLVKVGESLGKSLVASGVSFDSEAVLRAADAKLAASSSDGPLSALKRMAEKVRAGQ